MVLKQSQKNLLKKKGRKNKDNDDIINGENIH